MKGKKIVSTLLALLLLASLPVSALAAEWDIGKGDITVNAESGGQTVRQGGGAAVPDSAPVITGTSKENNVTINAEKDQTANVTLSGVNIDVRDKGKAAVSTTGEGNVSIELNGGSTLRSGYEHAGLEKNNGGSLTIADEDKNGKLTAWGGQQGAGIGGGSGKDGSNIFITGGGVNAIGGLAAAGIGGGLGGNGSNITISGGKVGATNGLNGAGIGGGQHGSGSHITISGGEVNAIGGKNGAGIGGGHTGDGSDIIISGGEVSASGGVNGAGIGGGCYGYGNNITVSGDAKLKVQGGVEDNIDGAGAGIGNGGSSDERAIPVTGAEVEPDTSGLTTNGSIEYYAPGADMEKDKPEKTTVGTLSPQEKPIEPIEPAEPEQPEAERGMDAPLYRVTDKDGRDIAYTAEQKGSVLTVTVDEDFAVLTASLSGMTALRAQGVEKIVFVTKGAASAFLLSDLLGKGESGEAYRLTHDGKAVTFTLGEKMTDVSAILTKP